MSFTVINPAGSAPPLAPYSSGTSAGGFVFVSGMLAMDEQGKTVAPGDVREQTRCVMDAIASVLLAADAGLGDIVFNQIFLKNLDDYAAFNAVYGSYFPGRPPARYCIRADLVRPDFVVEIVATAFVGNRGS